MQIGPAAAQVDLGVDQAAEAVTDRRHAAGEHRGVRDDHDVGGQLGLVRGDEVVEVEASDFFFPLDNQLHVHRQASVLREMRLDRLEVHEHLTLVVGRAAGVQLAVPDRRLERRRFPQVERIDRLDVVVAVKEDRRGPWRSQPVSVHHRIARSVDQAHVLQSDPLHFIRTPRSTAFDVVGVLG